MKVDRLTSSPHHKGVVSHAIMTDVEQHASCTKVAEEPDSWVHFKGIPHERFSTSSAEEDDKLKKKKKGIWPFKK